MNGGNSLQIKRVSLVDAVVERMFESIQNGSFRLGEKIPSESILTREFGVSRTTLREAFKKLENLGLISIKQGDGTYITKTQPDPRGVEPREEHDDPAAGRLFVQDPLAVSASFNPLLNDIVSSLFRIGNYQLSHYIEARNCIEEEALRLAVERMDAPDVSVLEENLAKQERTDSAAEFAVLDYDFHLQLIITSKNEFFFMFWTALSPFVKEQITRSSAIDGVIQSSCAYHRKIFNALLKKNYKRAHSLNIEHIRMFQGRMLVEASKHMRDISGQGA